MLSAERQETLTRVGPGTPMGELLRRYWMPVAASSDLKAGGARPLRLLGEDLVLFRDAGERPALLEAACPHRGASLAHGCVDREGIRCPYHGWKFDAAGACLEVPTEPRDSPLRRNVRARAYAVQELGGLVFAYLGPPPAPLLPRYDLLVWEGVLRDVGHALLPCNWLQIMENSVDPHHIEWLHGHHLAQVRAQRGESQPTHYRRRHVRIGFDVFEHGIIKRRVLEGGSEDDEDWRVGHPLVFPLTLRVGAHRQHRFQFRVPVDDTHTRIFWYACYRPPEGVAVPPQKEVPSYEVPWRDEHGDFLVDFVDGQDIMVWVSQGPIADRTRETLGQADRGIALYRRLLLEQMDRVRAGQDPLGVIRDPARNRIIELPQERDKFRDGAGFLAETLEMSHARYSPLKDLILELFGGGRGPARHAAVTRRRRFVLYNQSLTGTGHFVKTHEIARALAARHDVLLVDGGRPVPRPASRHPFASLALPRILRRCGRIAPADPDRSLEAVMADRLRMLRAAVREVRPHVLLVDQFPFFKWDLHDEIVSLIEAARAVRPELKVVCSTWELPRGTGPDVRAPTPEQVQRTFREHFDGLLIHADRRVLALEDHVPWADRIGVPRAYTGYVSEKAPPFRPRAPGPGPVVVSTGGASLPSLLRDSAAAWQRVRTTPAGRSRTMVAFLPPFPARDPLEGWPVPPGEGGVRIEPFATDFVPRLHTADLSISQAGYNTSANILETRVRAILVPNPSTLDQVARARRLAELGLARMLDPAELDADGLAAAIVETLATPPPRHDLDLEGAAETRRCLEDLAHGRAWPRPSGARRPAPERRARP